MKKNFASLTLTIIFHLLVFAGFLQWGLVSAQTAPVIKVSPEIQDDKPQVDYFIGTYQGRHLVAYTREGFGPVYVTLKSYDKDFRLQKEMEFKFENKKEWFKYTGTRLWDDKVWIIGHYSTSGGHKQTVVAFRVNPVTLEKEAEQEFGMFPDSKETDPSINVRILESPNGLVKGVAGVAYNTDINKAEVFAKIWGPGMTVFWEKTWQSPHDKTEIFSVQDMKIDDAGNLMLVGLFNVFNAKGKGCFHEVITARNFGKDWKRQQLKPKEGMLVSSYGLSLAPEGHALCFGIWQKPDDNTAGGLCYFPLDEEWNLDEMESFNQLSEENGGIRIADKTMHDVCMRPLLLVENVIQRTDGGYYVISMLTDRYVVSDGKSASVYYFHGHLVVFSVSQDWNLEWTRKIEHHFTAGGPSSEPGRFAWCLAGDDLILLLNRTKDDKSKSGVKTGSSDWDRYWPTLVRLDQKGQMKLSDIKSPTGLPFLVACTFMRQIPGTNTLFFYMFSKNDCRVGTMNF